jgi:ubiquinone/menaquinone biosynthesis C-methylase UbiE
LQFRVSFRERECPTLIGGRLYPAKVLTQIGVKPGMEVIDLCCGDGWFTLPIAKIAQRVIAIEDNKVKNCEYMEGDAYDIAKLVAHPVDFVFLANAFHGVPDKQRLACAVRAALRPGGRFAIINWHARLREETTILDQPRGPATELRMTPDATIAAVEPSGLKLRNIVAVSPYHYGAVFEN